MITIVCLFSMIYTDDIWEKIIRIQNKLWVYFFEILLVKNVRLLVYVYFKFKFNTIQYIKSNIYIKIYKL